MLSSYTLLSKRQGQKTPCRYPQLILLLSLASNAILLLYVLTSKFKSLRSSFFIPEQALCCSWSKAKPSGDFLGPYLRRVNASQDAHPEFGEEYSLLEEANMADKGGFLLLRESTGRVGFYGVSMLHQLHCLKMLKDRIEGIEYDFGNEHGSIHDQENLNHLSHCVEYISQAVICAADDTIEPARIERLPNGYPNAIIDGAGAVHHCRDSRALFQKVEDSASNPFSIGKFEQGMTVQMLAR